jgi:hypothetical protein
MYAFVKLSPISFKSVENIVSLGITPVSDIDDNNGKPDVPVADAVKLSKLASSDRTEVTSAGSSVVIFCITLVTLGIK